MIDETVEEIREMQTHSSSVVAVKATRALAELLDREYATVEEFERDLERNAGAFRRANSSHASLFSAMREIVESVTDEASSVEEAKSLTEATIDRVVADIETAKRRAAENAAERIADGERFLTHDYSSTVLEAVEAAARDGADLTAYVTEARPRFLGRKTARALAAVEGVETHLLVDSAAGHCLSDCDRVLIGMDCIVDGTLYNRVGTLPLAATAARLDVPVTVVGSGTKIVDDFVFENESRPIGEVALEPLEGIEIENPAYDATPTDLLSTVVTDEGVLRP